MTEPKPKKVLTYTFDTQPEKREISLGRFSTTQVLQNADFPIDNKFISRLHAQFIISSLPLNLAVRDCSSKTGSAVITDQQQIDSLGSLDELDACPKQKLTTQETPVLSPFILCLAQPRLEDVFKQSPGLKYRLYYRATFSDKQLTLRRMSQLYFATKNGGMSNSSEEVVEILSDSGEVHDGVDETTSAFESKTVETASETAQSAVEITTKVPSLFSGTVDSGDQDQGDTVPGVFGSLGEELSRNAPETLTCESDSSDSDNLDYDPKLLVGVDASISAASFRKVSQSEDPMGQIMDFTQIDSLDELDNEEIDNSTEMGLRSPKAFFDGDVAMNDASEDDSSSDSELNHNKTEYFMRMAGLSQPAERKTSGPGPEPDNTTIAIHKAQEVEETGSVFLSKPAIPANEDEYLQEVESVSGSSLEHVTGNNSYSTDSAKGFQESDHPEATSSRSWLINDFDSEPVKSTEEIGIDAFGSQPQFTQPVMTAVDSEERGDDVYSECEEVELNHGSQYDMDDVSKVLDAETDRGMIFEVSDQEYEFPLMEVCGEARNEEEQEAEDEVSDVLSDSECLGSENDEEFEAITNDHEASEDEVYEGATEEDMIYERADKQCYEQDSVKVFYDDDDKGRKHGERGSESGGNDDGETGDLYVKDADEDNVQSEGSEVDLSINEGIPRGLTESVSCLDERSATSSIHIFQNLKRTREVTEVSKSAKRSKTSPGERTPSTADSDIPTPLVPGKLLPITKRDLAFMFAGSLALFTALCTLPEI
ncbi:hypothetical protein BABINDRAFT_168636 [Babjeviella inositovora NRRL Y-12698]|uniref:FHA domain-containing protein n=1 Tax=Babjeviella inositovora NRRL Y-12698 TaxID=984486 RepID=A0A1E3QKB5_9ASCO|nr:uncharacterized protein BABINDRAFT_168636 [Babjeviella inositovora NRRL Y-12698]ODQ78058.1 hypothetical protein BABINDRAFT_168636 [Babjeviella inositovora NRRL Y-12698]